MTTTQDNLNGTSGFARLTAAILFVLMVGTGYTVAPRVEGAVDSPMQVEEQDSAEALYLPSECAVNGLVFASCNLDF